MTAPDETSAQPELKFDVHALRVDTWKEYLDLPNRSTDDLVDMLGLVKQQGKLLEKIEGFLAEVVYSRIPEGETLLNGRRFFIERKVSERTALSQSAIKEAMGEEWCKQYMSTTPVTSHYVREREEPK